MTTTENNRLIAEFMALTERYPLWRQATVAPRYWVSQVFQGIEDPDGNDPLLPEEMKFHTSWDWLMPVVEKIGNENYLSFDIEDTYNNVVEHIKWYNEQQK